MPFDGQQQHAERTEKIPEENSDIGNLMKAAQDNLIPHDHPLRGQHLSTLADALDDRYSRTGSENDLEDSIRLDREALTLRPVGHPDRRSSLNSLANALFARY